MGNAEGIVRENTDYITCKNSKNGVARAINNLIIT